MADLFVALGYELPRLNVHKSGRELDLSADHRLEPRRAIAECKATAAAIGGDDLNKFVGALDVEQQDERQVTGYFVSLSGFKETAIEQEMQRRRTKIITLTGPQVVDELVQGRILIARDRATEIAGRACAGLDHLTLDQDNELLAHERGWIWAIYYTENKARTHFVLIHSDGTPLAHAIAEEIISADRECGGKLHNLSCLNPEPMPGAFSSEAVLHALAAYRQYLESECGFIHLDGMPADSDVGSRRLRLESLFVPLQLNVVLDGGGEAKSQPVGAVVFNYSRLALLAAPGGGKSTLIKRLAIAYSDPARFGQVADDLPRRDWFPLFFRCRELRGLARGSLTELLDALSQREPVRQHAVVFRAYLDRALLEGRALLLVDGLDEISDSGDRAAFVCTLRSALQAYPNIAAIVTSREAGYRHVAPHLAPICQKATISPFDGDDIRRLTVAWYREVVGDTEKVRTDAMQLAATIVRNNRIFALAKNPLLLTTLLLVKRWVGSLPTRRAVLYGKAVEVLLMTWNTEGHEPIPEEEALPQLCYLAEAMMHNGLQKVSRPRLAAWLHEAREALPTELGYVSETVDEFIRRVEDRSSLLTMTGYDVEAGRLVEFFEFRHLTFQEFLTARAMVEGWHSGRQDTDTLVSVLEPHFEDEKWREVIPLAALLGGKATEGLILRLTEILENADLSETASLSDAPLHLTALGNCLADEAAARPETVRSAARQLVRFGRYMQHAAFVVPLIRGRYGGNLYEEARNATLAPGPIRTHAASALAQAVWWRTFDEADASGYERAEAKLVEQLRSLDQFVRVQGALGCMYFCYTVAVDFMRRSHERERFAEPLSRIGESLVPVLFSDSPLEQFAASWALSWLGACRAWIPLAEPDVLARLCMLWRHSSEPEIRRVSVWALAALPLAPRDEANRLMAVAPAELRGIIGTHVQAPRNEKAAALVVAWYVRGLADEQLAERAESFLKTHNRELEETITQLLEYLGKAP